MQLLVAEGGVGGVGHFPICELHIIGLYFKPLVYHVNPVFWCLAWDRELHLCTIAVSLLGSLLLFTWQLPHGCRHLGLLSQKNTIKNGTIGSATLAK